MPASLAPRVVPNSVSFHRKLLQVFESLPGTIGGAEVRAFWRAFYLTLFETSLPIDDIIRLRWSDVDLDRGMLTIPRGGVELFLSPDTVAALRSVEEPHRIQVFPWPGGAVPLHRAFNELTAKAAVMAEKGGDHHDA